MMSCLPYIILYKTCDPRGGTVFDPRVIIGTNLAEFYLVMLNTKNQGSWPCGFRQDFFYIFPI